MDPIYVTGHRNPDTDSIVSAMAYARLRNALGDNEYIAGRLGRINDETQRVLDRFGYEPPVLIHNMRNQVSDLNYDTPPLLNAAVTVNHAWQVLKKDDTVAALPVTNDDGTLFGMLSANNIASNDMLSLSRPEIKDIPVFNLVSALEGNIVLDLGTPTNSISGRVSMAIPANGEEGLLLPPNSILVCGNQPEIIMEAIKANVVCVIVCQSAIPDAAREITGSNTIVISTPHEPYRAARMIFQSVPVSFVCRKDDLCAVHLNDYVDDVREIVLNTKHRAYPVLDENDQVVGSLSRVHLLRPRKKRVVLVDHNEVSQSVPGLDQAEIVEIIDHHRLADVQTGNPIYMRNEPVGSTTTIVAGMFMERGLMPSARMAGIIACAILSDTLMFKSPTCTARDVAMAERMAMIARVSIEELGHLIFSASTASDKLPEDILFADFKEFMITDHTLGVGQVVTLDSDAIISRKGEFLAAMQKKMDERHYDMMIFMITDMLHEGSHLLFLGESDVIAQAFNSQPEENEVFLPGILSRKKQIIPSLSVFWG